jgi:L-2-hydroxyglutarate oxidase LhgO
LASERFDITVVGAGVVGCAIARELSQAGRDVVVLDKNAGVSRGENQSTRNSGVIHAGLYYDQETRPLKAALCAQGNRLLHRFCEKHQVPALKTGKLVVATNGQQQATLKLYLERARQNGVPVKWLEAGEVNELEPLVKAEAALYLPTSGIVDAAALVHKLYALASNQGAQFVNETTVTALAPHPEGMEVRVRYRDGSEDSILTSHLINSAGLYSDDVARMADPESAFHIDAVRCETMKFYPHKRPELGLGGLNIYPTPRKVTTDYGTYFTVGVHLTPTLETDIKGSVSLGPVVTVGPLNRPTQHKEDYGGDFVATSEFLSLVSDFFPALTEDDLEPHQVGILARLMNSGDWVIEFNPRQPRCLNLLGIDSPGLTGSLAIAAKVAKMLKRSQD